VPAESKVRFVTLIVPNIGWTLGNVFATTWTPIVGNTIPGAGDSPTDDSFRAGCGRSSKWRLPRFAERRPRADAHPPSGNMYSEWGTPAITECDREVRARFAPLRQMLASGQWLPGTMTLARASEERGDAAPLEGVPVGSGPSDPDRSTPESGANPPR